jgi:hypothetical protein
MASYEQGRALALCSPFIRLQSRLERRLAPIERRAHVRHASQAWGFPSIASAEQPDLETKYWKEGSLVTIAFRCELCRWSHQVLQEYNR